ncbi:unnamed protein product [Ostreobium quekettii]|uniref:Myb-like domain-containing protein n=1 Tax=Ostreobium quekettii TaxID=121088 RepID=A0A8S1IUR1_9CHLO|nr:unnamed protein product [Ostreobium quekettii]|eukprot:evm.model.scf_1543.6 EVM.evm.TU.scf_1543.6   scf_1543:34506-38302(+)
MVRKRHFREMEPWARVDKLMAGSARLDEMAEDQRLGNAFYGDCVFEPKERAQRTPAFYAGVNYVPLGSHVEQPPQQQITYLPPIRVTPNRPQCEDILQAMTAETRISEEEMQLITEAQNLGWSWTQIAHVFKGRTATQLKRILGVPGKAKRSNNSRREGETKPSASVRERGEKQRQEQAPRGPASADMAQAGGAATLPFTKKPVEKKDVVKGGQGEAKGREEHERHVNAHATNRAGGDDRVTLKRPLAKPPKGFSGIREHGLTSMENVKFYEEVDVIDPDDPTKVFNFNLNDPAHCACFNIGVGEDGSPLLSWSDLYSFYELPDGTKWAEHGYLYDAEDLEEHAKKIGKSFQHLPPANMHPRQLLKKGGRYHSKLQNTEFEVGQSACDCGLGTNLLGLCSDPQSWCNYLVTGQQKGFSDIVG